MTPIDLGLASRERDNLKSRWDYEVSRWYDNLTQTAKRKPDDIVAWAIGHYKYSIREKLDWVHYIGEKAKSGGLQGTLASHFFGEYYNIAHFPLASEIALDIPKAKIRAKAGRYWNRAIRTGRMGLPQIFRAYAKGYISEKQMRDYLVEETGIEPELENAMIDFLDLTPSPSELVRMRRVMPIPDPYIEDCLKENGAIEPDLSIYKSWIKLEGLKDEFSTLWKYVLSEFQQGFLTESQLQQYLQSLPASGEELNLRMASAKILRDIYLSKLLRDKWIYLYRNAKITVDELYDKLKQIGMDDGIANAIAQLEAAKKGTDWSR